MLLELAIVLVICLIGVWWKLRPIPGIKSITTDELQTMLRDKDKVFIDIRSPRDFKKMYVSPFINAPKGTDLSVLPKHKEIVVMCKSGIRSIDTCKELKKLGFEKVTTVKGGITSYREKHKLNE